MDLQADIKWIISELTKVKDPELISAFKSLLKYREKQVKADWWDEINEEERSEINEGVKQIEEGNVIAHKDVIANPRKWS
ncbi:MAG: hypothetical protein KAQ62_21485 [Cyclobacteriaceae bacterium]|nr:hypothetical protein [Cyclobacteriaceae bacterium]MCK5277485.1 hypothetical protein [Cyclobacteriaceae bacterium]MCK5371153.1 hypothetical protein [Cyclobacteriaceae bacterium]